VGSFNVEISALLTSYWSNFLKAFNAAKFTVKNISEASYDITLGESILEKSITAPLMYYGGLDYHSATKIYKHAISIVTNKGPEAEEVG
jgi:hypothetical protein